MKTSEHLAKACVEMMTRRQLVSAYPANDVPDFTCPGPPSIALEVKEVTVEETRRLYNQLRRVPYFESSVLKKWWTVSVSAPSLENLLPRSSYVPRPQPTDDHRTALADAGFLVIDDAAPVSPAILQVPSANTLCQRLEPLLEGLEERGVECTRAGHSGLDIWSLVWQVEHLTNNGIAMAHQPAPDCERPPGIDLAGAQGSVSTGDPDQFLSRIEEFISGTKGESLRLQLAACSAYDERHAFLVLDSTEPEWWRSHEWDTSVVPSRPPALPTMIDAIWIKLGSFCWRWHPQRAWGVSEVQEREAR